MADLVLKDRDGTQIIYNGIEVVSIPNAEGGTSHFLNLETGGIPSGGTAGQVLKKLSETDYDVGWEGEVDITGKADKVTGATADNIASLDADGNLKDSGAKVSDLEPALPPTPTDPEIKYLNGNKQWSPIAKATNDTLGVGKGSDSVLVDSEGRFYATAESIGAVAEVLVGETITLNPGEPAEVENVGTRSTPILKFKIPKGDTGEKGEHGDKPAHQWSNTSLRFENPDGTWGSYVNLKGDKGDKGEDGHTPIKGIDYFDGKDGKDGEQGIQGPPGLDGKSLEFHWNGTQLGVRVEGETTYQYVNLKGDKGDKGEQGIPGQDGKSLEFHWNGTQLGIRVEGEAAYQYVDLKGEKGERGEKGDDGLTPHIGENGNWWIGTTDTGVKAAGEQGEKGDDGHTPVKGIDYWTEADKGEIIQAVVDVMGGALIGYVDENNVIVLVGGLEGETYTVKYEMEDGSTIDIGELTLGTGEPRNLADPTSTDWLTDTRLSTTRGAATPATGSILTNYIPAKAGDILRVKGLDLYSDNGGNNSVIAIFSSTSATADANGRLEAYQNFIYTNLKKSISGDGGREDVSVNGDIYTYTIAMRDGTQRANAFTAYCRISAPLASGYTANDVIITINEEIV